jgi:MOSC domain-containing protein YiiM
MTFPRLYSLQVGMPQNQGDPQAPEQGDRRWFTGFFKEPVPGPVALGRLNLAGDGQADLKNHGGTDKAALAYSYDHYPYWQELLGGSVPVGGFGENFTVSGQTEDTVCLGDVYRIGTATVQVSQPRQPCWKLSRRWRRETLVAEVLTTGQSGWYFRVLGEGIVEAGQDVVLLERPLPDWSVARLHHLMHHDRTNKTDASILAASPLLSQSWRQHLRKRLSSD